MSFSDLFISDDLRGITLFERDPLAYKVPIQERREWVKVAEEIGKDTAEILLSKHGRLEPIVLAEVERVGIIVKEAVSPKLSPLSEYEVNSKTITLYSNVIVKLKELVKYDCSWEEIRNRINNILILHEMFHYLEDTKVGWTSKRKKVLIWKVWGYKHTSGLRIMSEIAAHAFVRTYLAPLEKYIEIKH